VSARLKGDLTLFAKQIGDGAVSTQVATMLAKSMAHFTGSPVTVVGHRLDQHRHTTRCVAFVGQLLNVLVVVSAHPTGNGPINGVPRHVGTQCLVHDGSQPGVVRRVATTITCRDRQLPDQLSKNLTALGILRSLAMLDIGPFTMSSHVSPRN